MAGGGVCQISPPRPPPPPPLDKHIPGPLVACLGRTPPCFSSVWQVEDPKDAKGNSDQGAQVAATDSHPLSVELAFDVRESDAEAGVCLKFHFVPVMNHVTVELALAKKAPAHFAWIGSAAVLRNLAPDDDGSAAPNPCTAYEVEAPAPPADGSRLPYKWLQWLAGYDFMFPIPQIPTSQTELCKSVGQVFNCRQRQSTGTLSPPLQFPRGGGGGQGVF